MLIQNGGPALHDDALPDLLQRPAIQWVMPIRTQLPPASTVADLAPTPVGMPARRLKVRRPGVPRAPAPAVLMAETDDESTPAPPNVSPDDTRMRQLDPAKLVRNLHLADDSANGDQQKKAWKSASVPSFEARLAAGFERAHEARAVDFGMAKVTEITSASDGTMRVYKIITPFGSYCSYYRRDGGKPSFGTCPR